MADTTFTNGVTLTDADWFNDLNRLHYTIFADPANLAAVRTTLAASDTEAGTVEYAVQSEMEAGTSSTRAVVPLRQQHHPSSAKAWASVGGASTVPIRASYNVSTSAFVSTGDYLFTFATNFATTNFAVVALSGHEVGQNIRVSTQTVSTIRLQTTSTGNLALQNADFLFFACYGDQ